MSTKQESLTRAIWRSADAVCFDVDSTVCRDEAIDELAKFAGVEKEVAEMTRVAMRGDCSFQDALAKRLELIKPSQHMVEKFITTKPLRLTQGIRELISLLQDRDIDVYLISGGFDVIIEPLAKDLGIPVKNIFANRIKFYYDGSYAGFDEEAPTSQQDGKAQVIDYLKKRYGYQRVVMIGDGATDLLACPPADAFIGFGGNQVRDSVRNEAKWFVMSFYDLIEELNKN
ncbi:phosphoserine phosphatase [Tetranychus urticae]|uniref:Phosphoserine phosphatase n=1 Tax=Tetranychus urticae TaxID=32264 RepID=T1KH44_TETUR|nr:phosphoserine phosphatase [Tetranychus urticae]XP_025016936.1 phosphoserine phosphatase [Tetranychus urticae]